MLFVHGFISGAGAGAAPGFAAVDDRTGQLDWSPNLMGSPFEALGYPADVSAFDVVGDRTFLVGDFTAVAGSSRAGAAAFDSGTGALLPWLVHIGGDHADVDIIAGAGGAVVLGGDFSTINGQTRQGIAAVSADEGEVRPWHPVRERGGYEANFVPAGKTLYVFSYNDAALAAFEPPASR
jgi:hypothetical protein